jgi:hypothetical protein
LEWKTASTVLAFFKGDVPWIEERRHYLHSPATGDTVCAVKKDGQREPVDNDNLALGVPMSSSVTLTLKIRNDQLSKSLLESCPTSKSGMQFYKTIFHESNVLTVKNGLKILLEKSAVCTGKLYHSSAMKSSCNPLAHINM